MSQPAIPSWLVRRPVLRKTKKYLLNTQLLEPHTNQQQLDHVTDVWPVIIVRYYQHRGVILRHDSVYARAYGVKGRGYPPYTLDD
jgi:hypothetical protein